MRFSQAARSAIALAAGAAIAAETMAIPVWSRAACAAVVAAAATMHIPPSSVATDAVTAAQQEGPWA